jgi:hypothetical protein
MMPGFLTSLSSGLKPKVGSTSASRPRVILALATVLAVLYPPATTRAQSTYIMNTLADGLPWDLVQDEAVVGHVSLGLDGRAVLQLGTSRISPTWRIARNGELCLKVLRLLPELCATLWHTKEGFIIKMNRQGEYRLSRG